VKGRACDTDGDTCKASGVFYCGLGEAGEDVSIGKQMGAAQTPRLLPACHLVAGVHALLPFVMALAALASRLHGSQQGKKDGIHLMAAGTRWMPGLLYLR
jgi:hypothetical protein